MERHEATRHVIERYDYMENRVASLGNAIYKIKKEATYLDCLCRRPGTNDCARCSILEIIGKTEQQ